MELGLLCAVNGWVIREAWVEPRLTNPGKTYLSPERVLKSDFIDLPLFILVPCLHEIHGIHEVVHGFELLLCWKIRMFRDFFARP
jgi:hypothetical protein